jgi:hypothetical protein
MSKPRKSKAAPSSAAAKPASEMILYQTDDNQTRIEVRLENETVWLTQAQMAELFQTTIPNVSMHIRNVYEEGELVRGATDKESLTVQPAATVKEFLIVRQEGNRQVSRSVEHYNLDVIISVGYRVDDFLRLSDREILTHAGKVSHEAALAKAEAEYEKFRVLEAAKPSPVEKHFQEAVQQVKQLSDKKPRQKKP